MHYVKLFEWFTEQAYYMHVSHLLLHFGLAAATFWVMLESKITWHRVLCVGILLVNTFGFVVHLTQ